VSTKPNPFAGIEFSTVNNNFRVLTGLRTPQYLRKMYDTLEQAMAARDHYLAARRANLDYTEMKTNE